MILDDPTAEDARKLAAEIYAALVVQNDPYTGSPWIDAKADLRSVQVAGSVDLVEAAQRVINQRILDAVKAKMIKGAA